MWYSLRMSCSNQIFQYRGTDQYAAQYGVISILIDESNVVLQYYTFFLPDIVHCLSISEFTHCGKNGAIISILEIAKFTQTFAPLFRCCYVAIIMTISKWDWTHICYHSCFPTRKDIQLDSNLSTHQEVRSATLSHLEPEDSVENCWPNRAKISKLETQAFATSSRCCYVAMITTTSKWDWTHICCHSCFPTGFDCWDP